MNKRPPLRHVLVWPEHGVEMAFRRIPQGWFRMGSRGYFADEEPIHRVRITEDCFTDRDSEAIKAFLHDNFEDGNAGMVSDF